MTGIPGVGKTTVLKELGDLANNNKFDLTVMNFGTVMNEIMHDLGMALHRDEMRQQSIQTQRKVQELAASEIVTRAGRGTAVIDTHMFVRTSHGLWAGMPQPILEKLQPSLLVLIEADPREILVRRRGDTDRRREQSLAEEISFDLEWSRATAAASAVTTGVPVKVIRNETGKQKQAALELFQAIRNAAGGQV